MTQFQRITKYAVVGFAVILAANIILGIVRLVIMPFNFLNFTFDNSKTVESYNAEFTNVNSLDIDVAIGELRIVEGDSFKVDGFNVSENFEATVKNGRLNVTHNTSKIISNFFNANNTKLIVTLPKGFIADSVLLKCDVGYTNIAVLNANMAAIESGVGKLVVEDCALNKLVLSTGVGETIINGDITGESSIETGIGSTEIKLKQGRNNYKFDISSGIGSVRINGEKYQDNNNNATNKIKIDSGIGYVNIVTG